jgi:hypothetical protein
MKNIHLIPTDKPSRLGYLTKKGKEVFKDLRLFDRLMPNILDSENQNIYITSDEEIKEGDYVINNLDKLIGKSIRELNSGEIKDREYSKIILTTDQDLIKDGVQAIDDEFLEWFVKNPSCESVEIEEICPLTCCIQKEGKTKMNNGCMERNRCLNYKIIIPKEEPKYVSSGGAKYVFGTVKGEYTIGNPSPNTVKGEFALAMGYNPETTNKPEGHHSIVIGNGLTSTKSYQLLVDRNGVKIDKIMTIEEYELLSQVLKSINDIKI